MRTIWVIIAAIAALTSCGTTGQDVARPETAATSSLTPDPPSAPGEEGDAPTTSAAVITGSDLIDVILTARDLPPGWTPIGDLQFDNDGSSASDCSDIDPLSSLKPTAEASATFSRSGPATFLFASVQRLADHDAAEAAMVLTADWAERCQTFTEIDGEGVETKFSLTPTPFPSLSDDTFAVHVSSGETFLGPYSLSFVVARVQDTIVTIGGGGFGASVDDPTLEQALRAMIDRL